MRYNDPTKNELLDSTAGDAAVIAAVTAAACEVEQIDVNAGNATAQQRIYGYDPERGHRLIDTIELDTFQANPAQRAGAVEVATPDALAYYADRHLDTNESTLWADIDAGRLTVILNDHSTDGTPGWGDHRATLQLQRPPEWKAWATLADRWLTQVELAEFLEEHLLEVLEPDGSTLLEVTQTFHATTGATFKSSQQLHSGEQRLVYEEDVQASAGRNQHVEIPTDLKVSLRPWLGVDAVEVAGKFRFRVRDGGLALGIRLLHLDDHSRRAVEAAANAVAESLGLTVIEGTAPAPRR